MCVYNIDDWLTEKYHFELFRVNSLLISCSTTKTYKYVLTYFSVLIIFLLIKIFAKKSSFCYSNYSVESVCVTSSLCMLIIIAGKLLHINLWQYVQHVNQYIWLYSILDVIIKINIFYSHILSCFKLLNTHKSFLLNDTKWLKTFLITKYGVGNS